MPLAFFLMSCASGASTLTPATTGPAVHWASTARNADLGPDPHDLRPLVVAFIAIDGVRSSDVFCRNSAAPPCSSSSLRSNPPAPGLDNTGRQLHLPHLAAMEAAGAALGAPGWASFRATGPNFVSLPGYMEMLSGSADVRCTENDCPAMLRPTLFDDFDSIADNAAVFSSWDKLEIAASQNPSARRGVLSAGARAADAMTWRIVKDHQNQSFDEAQLGAARKHDLPSSVPGNYRPDASTAQLALSYLRSRKPQFLFVSLGDTDEFGHANDRTGYDAALEAADEFVGLVRQELQRRAKDGARTLLLVTTDHGRSHQFSEHGRAFPESALSFLIAEGSDVQALGRTGLAPGYLRDIAPTVRALAGKQAPLTQADGRILREILR